jgi:hypothetical protein
MHVGNSVKPVTLGTLSLTKFLRHVFQGQETHDFRKPGTCEASDSRMRKIRNHGSMKRWSHEHAEARNLELVMARTSEDGRFGSLSGTQFESHARGHARIFEEAKAEVGNPSRVWFGSYTWRHSRTNGEAKSKLLSQKVRVLSVN